MRLEEDHHVLNGSLFFPGRNDAIDSFFAYANYLTKAAGLQFNDI